MTLIEMIENYGPIVFADSETGVLIQRNGAYLCWLAQERDGSYYHSDVRSVEDDAYVCTLAKAMESAQAWFDEEMKDCEAELLAETIEDAQEATDATHS